MNENEKVPGTEKAGRGGYIPILVIVLVVVFSLWAQLGIVFGGTDNCGTIVYFKSMQAFQKNFAPIMAFPTYFPEGFDWRELPEAQFCNEKTNPSFFEWPIHEIRTSQTYLYANAYFYERTQQHKKKQPLDAYKEALMGVSLAYPNGAVPDAWLFYVEVHMEINPAYEGRQTCEILSTEAGSARFTERGNDTIVNEFNRAVMYEYEMLYDEHYYTFRFAFKVNPELSEQAQKQLKAEMKRRCLEETVKMYDSLEYLE